jgi:anhydro-N-acetylmuramic acid kinase
MHGKGGMGKLLTAIGLMSGTSLDGIDVALIETDGESQVRRGPAFMVPYSTQLRAQLAKGLDDARAIRKREDRPGRLKMLEQYLTDLHAEAVNQFLEDCKLAREDVAVIGFHGQTVLHRPQDRLTVQLGDGAALARATGIEVVYDLRAADVAAGGQGAPLVPVYHRALAQAVKERPMAFLNIGGVANLTYIGAGHAGGVQENGRLIAFDTGPGNALIDDFVFARTGQTCDRDGVLALAGTMDTQRIGEMMLHPFFGQCPPKSLDRNAFAFVGLDGLSTEDGAATLAGFTAVSIAAARAHLPEEPKLWVVVGGGRRNAAIMSGLAARVENAVVPAEAVGLGGDTLEAEAWAYLAVRSLKGLPITFPETTGVARPTTGGLWARAKG